MKKWMLVAACLAVASEPVRADDFHERQRLYRGLSALDAAQTCQILGNGGRELNPILGGNPSCAKVVAFKLATVALHELIAQKLDDNDPEAARMFQIISIGIQGAVVAANLRVRF